MKEQINAIYYYSSSYKGIDYLLHYCEYKNEVRLQLGLDCVIEKFQNNNFQYETSENENEGFESVLIEGTFEKDDIKFAIKQQLIKKEKTHFHFLMFHTESYYFETLLLSDIDETKI